MGFLDKRNNKLRIVCAGICVIITVLLSGCSEEGSNINISESVEKYLAESELDGSRLLDINMKDITPLIGKYSETDFDKSVSEKEVQKNIEDILESYAKLKTVKRTLVPCIITKLLNLVNIFLKVHGTNVLPRIWILRQNQQHFQSDILRISLMMQAKPLLPVQQNM